LSIIQPVLNKVCLAFSWEEVDIVQPCLKVVRFFAILSNDVSKVFILNINFT